MPQWRILFQGERYREIGGRPLGVGAKSRAHRAWRIGQRAKSIGHRAALSK